MTAERKAALKARRMVPREIEDHLDAAAYQNGKRYHPECAERDGLLRPEAP